MKNIAVLQKILADQAKDAEVQLLNQYPMELVKPVIEKLQNLMKGIENESEQSIAIFVCPVSEKVIYFTYNRTCLNSTDYIQSGLSVHE